MSHFVGRRILYSLYKNRNVLSKFNSNILSKCVPTVYSARFKVIFKPISQREGPQPSRLHPGSVIERTDEYIESVLFEKTEMTHEDWDDFKTYLTIESEIVSDETFGAIVMNCLTFMNKLDLAHSFINYLESSLLKPNYLTYLKYISLCSASHRLVGQELILDKLNKVKHILDSHPVLDMKTAEYMIQGLCATDKWRESFEYIPKIQNKPSLKIRNALASAAIRNGDDQFAWEILTNMMKAADIPSLNVFEEFVLKSLEMEQKHPAQSLAYLQKVLQFMQSKDIIVSENVAKLIAKYFESHPSKWTVSFTKVKRNGECEACGSSLKLLDLTHDEFFYLQNEFLNRVVKKSDVFINTTPKEFQKYLNFINNYKPFHVVVDGLNAAHTFQGPIRSNNNLAFQLLKIVKKLAGSSRKVLVLGRRHMQYWPSLPMRKLSAVSKMFFTDNISQDDPFILYAALASGPHTLFFSLDLMRDHLSRLEDPYTINLFKRWQQSHQIFVNCDKSDNIKFVPPLNHSIHVQGNMEKGWHIPFDDNIALDPYEELNNWLCVQRDLKL